jgi:hypothetical protein
MKFQPSRSSLFTVIVFLALALLIAAYFFEMNREAGKLAPPEGCATLLRFKSEMPAPRRLTLIRGDGTEYFLWTGEWGGPVCVPSGPSRYLFDKCGNLVDWEWESGEGSSLDERIASYTVVREINLDEAISAVGRGERPVQEK